MKLCQVTLRCKPASSRQGFGTSFLSGQEGYKWLLGRVLVLLSDTLPDEMDHGAGVHWWFFSLFFSLISLQHFLVAWCPACTWGCVAKVPVGCSWIPEYENKYSLCWGEVEEDKHVSKSHRWSHKSVWDELGLSQFHDIKLEASIAHPSNWDDLLEMVWI